MAQDKKAAGQMVRYFLFAVRSFWYPLKRLVEFFLLWLDWTDRFYERLKTMWLIEDEKSSK